MRVLKDKFSAKSTCLTVGHSYSLEMECLNCGHYLDVAVSVGGIKMSNNLPDGFIGGMSFMDEKRLWFELDKIATVEAGPGMNMAKTNAAVCMMLYLEKPSPEECRQMYIEDGN